MACDAKSGMKKRVGLTFRFLNPFKKSTALAVVFECGEKILRDVNAVLNIRALGILKITRAERTGEPAEFTCISGGVEVGKDRRRSFA
jgi:hypothetical protein